MKKTIIPIILLLFCACSQSLAEDENLLPSVNKQKGPEPHWQTGRNVAAQVAFSLDDTVVCEGEKQSLKVSMKSPEGYGEWRVFTKLPAGKYTFSVLVKNRTEKEPYFTIYSFDASGKATLVRSSKAKAGNNDWHTLSKEFVVPENSDKLRIGIGLSTSPGEVWFSKPSIKSAAVIAEAKKSSSAEENLLPSIDKQKGPEPHWQTGRNVAAQVTFSVDDTVVCEGEKQSLKVSMKSPEGYGEWRVFTKLSAGKYTFSVQVKNRTEKEPYFTIHSFDNSGKATLICGAKAKAGNNDWHRLSKEFVVPENSAKIRVDVGLSSSPGEVWFCKPVIKSANGIAEAMKSIRKETPDVPNHWVAEWIWVKDPGAKIPNVAFTKKVTLKDAPESASMQITADNLYELYVNGKAVGNDADWQTVEKYDIASFLQKGENEIRVMINNFGGPGGMLLQAAIWEKDGKTIVIKSDKSWSSTIDGKVDAAPLELLGSPPEGPWGPIPYQSLMAQKSVRVPLAESTTTINPGETFRALFRIAEDLPADELANLNLEFTQNGQKKIISGHNTIISKHWDKKHIAVELPISRYAVPGKYRWTVKGIALNLVPEPYKNELTINKAAEEDFAPATYPKTAVNKMNGPEGDQPLYNYATCMPSVESYITWQTTDCHIYEIDVKTGYWTGPEEWDTSHTERSFMQMLEADPEATIYLRLRVDTPSWWIRENPQECFLSQKGRRGPQSFASDVWRKAVAKGVYALIDKLAARPVGKHLGGAFLMGYKGGEFQLWGESQGEYDCSPAAKKTFADWQNKNGIPGKIPLPHPALEFPFAEGESYAEIRRTFFRFVAERQSDNLIYFADKFKEKYGDKYQLGVYYGYPMEHAGMRMFYSGHLGASRVINNAKLDMISCPTSYALRPMELSHAYMLPADSALMHNIMPVLENDIRNYRMDFPADGSGKTLPDLFTTLNSFDRLCLLAAGHGTAVRYLALSQSIDFFQDSAILADIRRIGRKVMKMTPADPKDGEQIVMVLNYLEYCGATEKPYFDLIGDFLGKSRDVLMRTGRSVAFVTIDDWMKNKALWKYAVFPLPGLLTAEQKKAIAGTFKSIPAIKPEDGALVMTPGKSFTTSSLREMRDGLATQEALKAGYDVIWYIGGNFKAVYDTTVKPEGYFSERLKISMP